MKRFFRHLKWLIVAVFSMGLLAACGVMRSAPIPTPTPGTVQVTAAQIAQAMQEDHFFSDYGNDILQVSGTVKAVSAPGSDPSFTLDTGIATAARCHLAGASQMPKVGAAVTVQSGNARREPDAVGLMDCTVIGP